MALCVLLAASVLVVTLLLCTGSPALFGEEGTGSSGDSGIRFKILAVNDFHGQLPPGQIMNDRPAGSAPVLAAYLKQATAVFGQSNTILALPGDIVGASPPESGLLHDEPALLFFNDLAGACSNGTVMQPDPGCMVVATAGNHDFDRPTAELLRQVYGGNGTTAFPHPVDPYPGFFPGYTCSNIVFKENGTLLFPPYVIRSMGGVPVAFIGADTSLTPTLLAPDRAGDVQFLNETASINHYVTEVNRAGVHAIVVLLHEGGDQQAYEGATKAGGNVSGRVTGIVAGLDGDVDVVLSAHTHKFTNTYLPNREGRPVLVTQAYSYGKGYADINLTLDPSSRDIVEKTAQIVITYADTPPGSMPDPGAAALLARTKAIVAPEVGRHVAVASRDISGKENACGESELGDLLADAQRSVMKTDVAFITTGTLRADLEKGEVTWGDLFSVQPFSGTVVSMNLTGRQIQEALERQWVEPLPPHNLGVSGLTYRFSMDKPAGNRVEDVRIGGVPVNPDAVYSAAVMDYLSIGGDRYIVFTEGSDLKSGPLDVDAFAMYLAGLPQPVNGTAGTRILCTGTGSERPAR